MLQIYVLALMLLFRCLNVKALRGKGDNAGLNATEQIKYFGYPLEIHTTITSDGYILELHRIPHGLKATANTSSAKQAVIFVHGIFCTSGVYLINGRDKSLPYELSDRNYDVWLVNLRGTPFSMGHVSLDANTNGAEYWNFTVTEYCVNDMKATFDYVLNITGNEKVYYVGHSQGGVVAFIFLSVMPEYNSKVETAFLLAPVSYVKHFRNLTFIVILKICGTFQSFLNDLGIYRLGASLSTLTKIQQTFPLLYEIVYFLIFGGADSKIFDRRLFPAIAGVFGGDAGVKLFAHYNQLYMSGRFGYYNYGKENLEIYGQITPPDYPIQRITAPVAVFYAQNEALISAKDTEDAMSQLPNLRYKEKMSYRQYAHLDFLWSKTVNEDVYNKIIEMMESDKRNGG